MAEETACSALVVVVGRSGDGKKSTVGRLLNVSIVEERTTPWRNAEELTV